MSKKIEVEIRIFLKNRKAIEEKLKNLDAKVVYATHLVDYWFCPDSAKNYKDASVDKTGFALRIRESKDNYSGKRTASLECKVPLKEYGHWGCHEHEMEISDVLTTRKILDDIGLKEFLVIDKQRVIYEYRGAKFCFEKIKGLGDGLEIEIMANKSNVPKAREKAVGLALSLGIKREEILEKSLTYLAMQKIAKF